MNFPLSTSAEEEEEVAGGSRVDEVALSREKVTDSCRRRISAVITRESDGGDRNPARGSSMVEEGVKSHQPWDFFLGENRCHESREMDLESSSTLDTVRR